MSARKKYHPGKLETRRARGARWRARNPKKFLVEKWTARAVRRGDIPKLPCEVCGSERFVVAHHDDYDRRPDVRWLCRVHHQKWHAENGEGANAHTEILFEPPAKGKYRGVTRDGGTWRGFVYLNRKMIWHARFGSAEEAARARDAKIVSLGLPRPLNFPSAVSE